MALHDMAQTFSFMQRWQMANPQRQLQQNKAACPQIWQVRFFVRRRRFSRICDRFG